MPVLLSVLGGPELWSDLRSRNSFGGGMLGAPEGSVLSSACAHTLVYLVNRQKRAR